MYGVWGVEVCLVVNWVAGGGLEEFGKSAGEVGIAVERGRISCWKKGEWGR